MLIERKDDGLDNLNFLSVEEKNFIKESIKSFQAQLYSDTYSPQSSMYKDLQQNIFQFKNLDKYKHEFIKSENDQILGIRIFPEPKE